MSLKVVRDYLKKYDLDHQILEFDQPTASVAQAASTINCLESDIAKTLAFYVNEQPIVIVVAGNCKIDNNKYKKTFAKKAKMIPFDDVKKVTGHLVGGVCPFGLNENVDIYFDVSLKEHEIVYPACGDTCSAIKIQVSELEKIVPFKKWVDVCKTN